MRRSGEVNGVARSSVRRALGGTLENGATMKVQAAIDTYGTKNAGCAKRLITGYCSTCCNVDIVRLFEIRMGFRPDITEFRVYPSRFAAAVVCG